MKTRIHPIAGMLAVVIIATFWIGTVGTELFGTEEHIRTVKLMIPWGFLILVPSLALAGGTGHLLGRARTGRLVASKRKRMPSPKGRWGEGRLNPPVRHLRRLS